MYVNYLQLIVDMTYVHRYKEMFTNIMVVMFNMYIKSFTKFELERFCIYQYHTDTEYLCVGSATLVIILDN